MNTPAQNQPCKKFSRNILVHLKRMTIRLWANFLIFIVEFVVFSSSDQLVFPNSCIVNLTRVISFFLIILRTNLCICLIGKTERANTCWFLHSISTPAGLSSAEGRSWDSVWVSHMVGKDPVTWSMPDARQSAHSQESVPGCRAQTWTQTLHCGTWAFQLAV